MRPRTVAGNARTCRRGVGVRPGGAGPDGRRGGAEPPAKAVAARRAVEPAAPVLAGRGRRRDAGGAVRRRRGRAPEARRGGERRRRAAPTSRWSRGSPSGSAARPTRPRATLAAALKAAPEGPWAAKIRLELAGVLLAAGQGRRRRGAGPRPGRGPARRRPQGPARRGLPRLRPPPAQARRPGHARRPQGRLRPARPGPALAKGEPLRARLLYAQARAAQAANDHAKAIADFQAYLKEYPKGADRLDARYHLGEAQRDAGPGLARPADLDRPGPRPRRPEGPDAEGGRRGPRPGPLRRSRTTYGVPAPADDTSLNLGVAALRRFLAAYPAHPLAVKAAYQIGASYLARGKSEEALDAFTRFLKDEGFRPRPTRPSATWPTWR